MKRISLYYRFVFVCKIVLVEDVGWVNFQIAGYHYLQYNVSATLYYQYSFVDKLLRCDNQMSLRKIKLNILRLFHKSNYISLHLKLPILWGFMVHFHYLEY